MRTTLIALALLTTTLSTTLVVASSHAALAPQDDTLKPVAMRADLAIASVTVYRGRAAVTRSGAPTLAQGLYELRVGPLPLATDLDSVQARLGGTAKLLDVKTETVILAAPSSDNPRVREALANVDESREKLTDIARRTANNAALQKTIDSIAAKVASDASRDMGTTLDPEKLRGQLVFIESERERLTEVAQLLAKEKKDVEGELAAREHALAAAGGDELAERPEASRGSVPCWLPDRSCSDRGEVCRGRTREPKQTAWHFLASRASDAFQAM